MPFLWSNYMQIYTSILTIIFNTFRKFFSLPIQNMFFREKNDTQPILNQVWEW